jgi:transposase InsO family protein
VNVYPFVEAEKAEQDGNVAMACRLLEVSRAAYYEWSSTGPSARELSDGELAERIKQIHKTSQGRYGAPRITDELRDDGVCVGKKRVARLMALNGLVGRCKRRFKKTTIADPNAETKAIDLIRRNFGVGVREIDTAWCGDITYVRTWEGWLYLATVIDFESRRVVGFAMADHMRADLVTDALQMAINLRRPAPGLIFHSDRGSQTPLAPSAIFSSKTASFSPFPDRASAGTRRRFHIALLVDGWVESRLSRRIPCRFA